MITWFKNNRDTVIRNSFLLPILLVVVISISHVVSWYDLGNPISWAIYLSVAIEIFALASVSAASIKMSRGSIWFLFGLVTAIQMVGNIFYEFKDINPSDESFIAWMELIEPLFVDWEILDHRRFLAAVQGGTLPLMSLTALHFYIKFNDNKVKEKDTETDDYFEARNRKIEEMVAAKENEDSEDDDIEVDPPNENLRNAAERYQESQSINTEDTKPKSNEVHSGNGIIKKEEPVDEIIEKTEKMAEEAIKSDDDIPPRTNRPSGLIESGTGLPVQTIRKDKGNDATQKAATSKDVNTTTGRFDTDKNNQNE